MKLLVQFKGHGVYHCTKETFDSRDLSTRIKISPVLGDAKPFFTQRRYLNLFTVNHLAAYPLEQQIKLKAFLNKYNFSFPNQLTLNDDSRNYW